MQESEAIIERVWQVGPGVQRLELAVEPGLASLEPGQSLLARSEDRWQPYMRDHWIPVNNEGGLLTIELPEGEHYSPGQIVSVLGPIGEPFPWMSGGGKHLLLIAQDVLPTSLLFLAKTAVEQTAEVALVLLGTSVDYPFAGIPAAVEVINGDADHTWPDDSVIIGWADQIFATVGDSFWLDQFSGLLHKIEDTRGRLAVNSLYGVFTLPLPCGTGACGACMIRCKTTAKLTCTQGPALDLSEVQLL
jgi:NAD(P)H-flavin reductase